MPPDTRLVAFAWDPGFDFREALLRDLSEDHLSIHEGLKRILRAIAPTSRPASTPLFTVSATGSPRTGISTESAARRT